MYHLGKKSRSKLENVHTDLILLVGRAICITEIDFSVLEGRRSRKRQKELFESGASQTMNSRHLTGHAVDLGAYVGGRIRWDWPLYDKIAVAMKTASAELNIPIKWGGDWKSFKDGPHFELPWRKYRA